MNILLVRPKPHKDTINLQSFMICEPLELEILSAALEKEGHKTVIADMIAGRKRLTGYLKDIDMVCFTAYLVHVGVVKKYAREVKRRNINIITVAGGVHAEVMPSDFVDPNIDYIISRKPVKALLSLAGAGKAEDEYADCFYSEGAALCEPDIDLNPPFPDRRKTAKYRKKYNYVLHSACATLKTSYGCPYKCGFCFCREITGGKYACRKMTDVLEELKGIEESNVFIVDDNFLTAGRIEEFCAGLQRERIVKNFIMFGRADFISANEDKIALLALHGLKAVFIGIESFKRSELDLVDKRTTVEMNTAAVKVLERQGVESYMGLICMPDWEREDFDALIKYLDGFKYPFINLQPITPIPGTPLYEKERSKQELDRGKYHLWDMAHLTVTPSKMTVRAFYRNILRVYFKTAASRRVRKYIRKRYGMRTYLRALKGAAAITWQYFWLSVKNKVNI